jgi:hypothetical protein
MGAVKRDVLTLILASLLVACEGRSVGAVTHEAEATAIAEAYVHKAYPEINRSAVKPRTTDQGKYWFVAYDPPVGSAGGGPKLVIEKSSGKVVVAFMDQ